MTMPDHVYKRIDLTGTSTTSIEDAVQKAITKASTTLHGLRWFEIADIRGDIENNKVAHWQVSLKIGFTLDE
jgi:flavin-binding protein dodecin